MSSKQIYFIFFKLFANFNHPQGSADEFENVLPADACALLVAFLQELPEGLVPLSLQEDLLAVAGMPIVILL